MVNFASIVHGTVVASSLFGMAVGHPGEKHDLAKVKREIDIRQMRAVAAKRALSQCQGSIRHRDLMQRAVTRRSQALGNLRAKRNIKACKFQYLVTITSALPDREQSIPEMAS